MLTNVKRSTKLEPTGRNQLAEKNEDKMKAQQRRQKQILKNMKSK